MCLEGCLSPKVFLSAEYYNWPSWKGGKEWGAGRKAPEQPPHASEHRGQHLESEGQPWQMVRDTRGDPTRGSLWSDNSSGSLMSYLWRHWTIALLSKTVAVWVQYSQVGTHARDVGVEMEHGSKYWWTYFVNGFWGIIETYRLQFCCMSSSKKWKTEAQ